MSRDDEGQEIVAQLGRVHPPSALGVVAGEQQIEKVGHRARPALPARRRSRRRPSPSCCASPGPSAAGRGAAPRPARRGCRAARPSRSGRYRRRSPGAPPPGQSRSPPEKVTSEITSKVAATISSNRLTGAPVPAATRSVGLGGMSGGSRHHRGQCRDMTRCEDRRGGAALPVPVRALGHEQAFADRRARISLVTVDFG